MISIMTTVSERIVLLFRQLSSILCSNTHAKKIAASFSAYFGIGIPPSMEEDGEFYALVKEFPLLDNTYYLFVDESNPRQIFFRKNLVENGEEYFVGLDNIEELNRLIRCYQKEIVDAITEWKEKYYLINDTHT